MPIIRINGIDAHYREWPSASQLGLEKVSGTRATILVLHGWGADSAQYETFGQLLAKDGVRVIVPDLPGWGSTPPPPCPWDVGDYMEWVHDFVQTIGIAPSPDLASARSPSPQGRGESEGNFILFGHSFGGRVSIKYSAKYPQNLQGLILCSSAGIKPTPTLKRRLAAGLTVVGRGLFGLPGLRKFAPFAREALYSFVGAKDYLRAEGIMKKTIVKVLKEDLTPFLSGINIPTLLLWGTLDVATPLKHGKLMEKLIPGAKLVVFENARHNLPKIIPEKLVEEVKKYLSEISPPYLKGEESELL